MEKLQPLMVQSTLRKRGFTIFTPSEFSRLFNVSPARAKYFLETYTSRGLFARLKRGLYALQSEYPGEEVIANALYRPSYLSFEYALARHNLIPEMVYVVTSATTKPTRSFEVEAKSFEYLTIKKAAYTGYVPMRESGNGTILLAEPEKALVDYLYFVSLGKKPRLDRLTLTHLSRANLKHYAQLYNRPRLNELVATL